MIPALRSADRAARELGLPAPLLRLPPAERGMTVGLFGGSFNPVHEGHLLVAETALRRLSLDRLWWLVSPGNPLKDKRELAPLRERIETVGGLAKDPRFAVTGFEARAGTVYTADLIRLLVKRRPHLHFVWVMGADSLASFHRWQRFRDIVDLCPVAVVDRPGSTFAALSSPMARIWRGQRMAEQEAERLPFVRPPAWIFLHGPRSSASSTALRRGRDGIAS